jgi:hypothetical protein
MAVRIGKAIENDEVVVAAKNDQGLFIAVSGGHQTENTAFGPFLSG